MTGHNYDVPEAEVRAWAEAMMDERAAGGTPYVFAGLPSALAGPYDESCYRTAARTTTGSLSWPR